MPDSLSGIGDWVDNKERATTRSVESFNQDLNDMASFAPRANDQGAEVAKPWDVSFGARLSDDNVKAGSWKFETTLGTMFRRIDDGPGAKLSGLSKPGDGNAEGAVGKEYKIVIWGATRAIDYEDEAAARGLNANRKSSGEKQ